VHIVQLMPLPLHHLLLHLNLDWLNLSGASLGCLTLLKILEIYWKFTVSWKFSGLVCAFVVNISYNSCISECISTN